MFKLHIYNPEHDIALGKNESNFTPPKAARLTRNLYCHIPSCWAEEGDWVLVDDVKLAEDNLAKEERKHVKVRFVTFDDLNNLKQDELPYKIEPWGWDRLIVSQLVKCNPLFKALVPSEKELDEIRRLSSREFAAGKLLPQIVAKSNEFIGEAMVFRGSVEELEKIAKNNGSIVLKSPWSCSGRGVKFIDGELTESEKGWVRNILNEQGAIMIEPKYNKVLDFAMEFKAEKNGGTKYLGLNIFDTKNGAYMQNTHAKEENKLAELGKHVDIQELEIIKNIIIEITNREFSGRYFGPFGVDMMIVRDSDNKTKVHPCVEMNLRRTMGQIGL